ncbi:hypothetical protein [Dysgonomonas sp. GY617]|uniref:hypothetical protein n=1 Tax=Dysgonomonas sp. GY617 TaxID=2780420 RepID=UPI0018847CD0|nr:hypothetical protein [Dysgonomonas sp. GY617]
MTVHTTSRMSKQRIFLILSFLVLFLGFYSNFWQAARSEAFGWFDEYSECLAIGRIARSETEGVFSDGGLPGVNYDAAVVPPNADIWFEVYLEQRPDYLTDNIPASYDVYKSQTGGQLIFFSIVQKILPFDNSVKFQILHCINAILSALCFTLFLGWVFRNFGTISAIIALLLVAMSSWITLFGHSLWWSLWAAYIPFVTMLLVLEYSNKVKRVSSKKILLYLFLSVFAKCVFNGYEFISTALVSAVCPIIFYSFLEGQKLKPFLLFFAKASITAVVAVALQIMMLIVQIRSVTGSFSVAINYIITSYTRRSFSADDAFAHYPYSLIFKRYLKGNAFNSDFLSQYSIVIYFAYLILAVVVLGGVVYYLSRGLDEARKRLNITLLVTAAVSSVAPLSWFIVFKQHSANHFHLDYIVWYMPFLLLGFIIIGEGISLMLNKLGLYNRGLIK